MKKYFIFFTFFLLYQLQASATHIVGGEFEMRHIAGSTYRLTLNLYFDRVNGSPNAQDSDITVGIYEKGSNKLKMSLIIPFRSETNINYTELQCALPGILRTSKLVYYRDISLNPLQFDNPEGYYAIWQRCCRNHAINNIVAPDNTGQTFYMEFPPVTKNGQPFRNSSPVLAPPISDYACLNELFYYDFSATDSDGDSLVYDLVTPIRGSSSGVLGNEAPDPPEVAPYPFALVNWVNQVNLRYSQQVQIIGNPALTVHPATGRLTVRPSIAGLFVFGIRCQEFRNGVKIGEVRREYQLMVRPNCKPNAKPAVSAIAKGKGGFYQPGEVIRISPADERCFDIKFTDPDPNTRVTLKTLPVNFSNSDFTLGGVTSGIINMGAKNDTLTASICFANCFDTGGQIYEMDFIAFDEGCSQPKLDTLRMRFVIEPLPDTPPTITLSSGREFSPVRQGDLITFLVTGNDAQGDIISITARGVGFELGSQNITFQNQKGTAPLTSAFSWPIDCQALQNERYQIEFTVTTDQCGEIKTATELVTVRTINPNTSPLLSSDKQETPEQKVLTFDLTVDEPFEANLTGIDADLHELLLTATGQGFNLEAYGMTFLATGGAGSATGVFRWVATCEAARQGTISVSFLLKEMACTPFPDQLLTMEFRVNFPNTAPVISTDRQEQLLVYELDLHQPFEARFFGNDIDLHPLQLLARGQGFDLARYGMSFQATGGEGSAEGVFKWVANCEAAEQGVLRVDFLLQENACIPSPDQQLALEFRVKVPDIQEFIPANIFTPNGDGLNDYFEMPTLPLTTCQGTFERITIFNRWGKEVYSSQDLNFRWDGRNVIAGVYYYIIDYTTSIFKGSVTIVH